MVMKSCKSCGKYMLSLSLRNLCQGCTIQEEKTRRGYEKNAIVKKLMEDYTVLKNEQVIETPLVTWIENK